MAIQYNPTYKYYTMIQHAKRVAKSIHFPDK